MKIAAIAAVLALVPALASGETLYRCKDAKGVSSYQQTPCPSSAKEAGQVQYQRQADRPHWTPEIQAQRDYEAYIEHERQATIAAYEAAAEPAPPSRSDLDRQRRAAVLDSLLQEMESEQPPADISPRQLRDQRGNTYTQPNGSAFARDSKTGKQCFVNGAFVHC